MFNCKEVSRKVSLSLDTSLPLHQRVMIGMHLLMCRYCNRLRKQVLMLRKAVRLEKIPEDTGSQPEGLSGATRERIKKAVREALP
jgi:hypothetical protein